MSTGRVRSGDRIHTSGRKDCVIQRPLRCMVFFLYESVEAYSPESELTRYPTLMVSKRFGGFADPLLVMYAAPLRPRIMARDKNWKIPVAGSIMNWLGAIQIHKPEEQEGRTSNKQMFQSAYDALSVGTTVLILPEGITRGDPSIAQIRTGGARVG